ncbi:MAG: hypothetical protein ABIO46_07005 [Chitinophagales bacterium]
MHLQIMNPVIVQLPSNPDIIDFIKRYHLHPQFWIDAIRETCELHQIPAEELTPFSDGSNLIAAINKKFVVKIFPPFHRHQWESEYRVLQHLNGKTTIPIPDLIAHGERNDRWSYFITGRDLQSRKQLPAFQWLKKIFCAV